MINLSNSKVNQVLGEKKLFIFDMDGTIYLGERTFDFAINFINALRAAGKQILFFTNNASHSTSFYYSKLEKRGFSPRENEIMTAGDVTAVYLTRHRKGSSVYLVGTDDLIQDFIAKGINIIGGGEKRADIVITSFDTSLTYQKLTDACTYIRNGAEYLCTHPDFNCPTEDGYIPDSGAIAALVTASTNVKPTYFGKPYTETIEMIAEATGCDKSEMCIFGDRLYTDIALGKKNGVTACLVLTGETTVADTEAADPADKPDFIFDSLDEANSILFGNL